MRLVTRGDLDGLTCAVLVCLNESIDGILLIHPQDITEDRVEIRDGDIIAFRTKLRLSYKRQSD